MCMEKIMEGKIKKFLETKMPEAEELSVTELKKILREFLMRHFRSGQNG